jgi:hypothetical protein
MTRVLAGRFTARMDEPFVVFIIGMRPQVRACRL